jgi:hypothetical protein
MTNVSVPKQINWVESVLPYLDEKRFKEITRTTHEQFQFILNEIKGSRVFEDTKNQQFPVSVQLCLALCCMGNNGEAATIPKVAGIFGIGDGSTITRVVRRVQKVCDKYILYFFLYVSYS